MVQTTFPDTHKSVLKSSSSQNGFVLTKNHRLPPSSRIQFKMASFKQLFINTFLEIATLHPPSQSETALTPEESRDEFLRRLVAALFPESPEVTLPAPVEIKTKKTKNVAAPEVVPTPAAEVSSEPVSEVVVAVSSEPAAPAEASPEKKKRAPMTEEAKAAMKAKKEATLAAKRGEAVRPAPADSVLETSGSNAAAGGSSTPEPAVKEKKTKKTKPAEDANLQKIDPTWKKHLKHADKEHAKELEPALLTYLNALSKEDFNAKKAEEHVADFIASRVTKAVESDGKVEADLDVVEFEGKEYYVNPETKRVYEGEGTFDEETGWTNYKPVGYVGMASFAEMKVE